jgi:TPR repeat protein
VKGLGVSKNEVDAARYYNLSADQGNAYVQYSYGFCLANGRGVLKNDVEAVRYFKLLADQGTVFGQCCYGTLLPLILVLVVDLLGFIEGYSES